MKKEAGPADPVEIASYGAVAQALHWAVALLAIVAIGLGLAIAGSPRDSERRALVLLLHRSVGISILVLTAFRVGWRLTHPPPPSPAGMPRLEAALTRADHIMLCLIFLAMPLSGYLNAAAAGHEVSWFGLFAIPPLVMRDDRLSQIAIAVHLAGQFLVYLFVFLHVAAALIHRVVRRDAVLQWMLPARRPRITATPPS